MRPEALGRTPESQELGVNNRELCEVCETLPHLAFDGGKVHVHLPQLHAVGKLKAALNEDGWDYRVDGKTVSIVMEGGRSDVLARKLRETFSSIERGAARALYVPTGKTLGFNDYFGIDKLDTLLARMQAGSLIAMVEAGQLTAHFQPIVSAGDSGRIYAYEALLRGTAGRGLESPDDIFRVARDADLLAQVDLAARRTAIQEYAKHAVAERIFINFAPSAIYDPATCLRTTVQLLDDLGISHDRVVFEVVESEDIDDIDHLSRILDYYRSAGFRVALDDLGAGFSSLTRLAQLRPDYVKLDIELVRNVDVDRFKGEIAKKLIEAARTLELSVIAEGVETKGEFDWVVANGANFVQGFYVGKPATPPPKLAAVGQKN